MTKEEAEIEHIKAEIANLNARTEYIKEETEALRVRNKDPKTITGKSVE